MLVDIKFKLINEVWNTMGRWTSIVDWVELDE